MLKCIDLLIFLLFGNVSSLNIKLLGLDKKLLSKKLLKISKEIFYFELTFYLKSNFDSNLDQQDTFEELVLCTYIVSFLFLYDFIGFIENFCFWLLKDEHNLIDS